MWLRLKQEPALVLGIVQALVVVGVTFGLRLSDEQTAAILAATGMLLAIWTRQVVTPVGKVKS
jgi:hypothetical protein